MSIASNTNNSSATPTPLLTPLSASFDEGFLLQLPTSTTASSSSSGQRKSLNLSGPMHYIPRFGHGNLRAVEDMTEVKDFLESLFKEKSLSKAERHQRLMDYWASIHIPASVYSKLAFFDMNHYTRNLIFANDDFELILMCWGPGQRSRIHDHGNTINSEEDQSPAAECYVKVLENSVLEVLYDGDLVFNCKTTLQMDDVGHINNERGFHILGNSSDSIHAISLHLYTPPIRVVNIFDAREKKLVERRTPGFYSKNGVKLVK